MATYEELMKLRSDDALRNRISVALTIAAEEIISDTVNLPSSGDQKWASAVFSNPQSQGKIAMIAVLANRKGLTPQEFSDLTDNQIQNSVNKSVKSLIVAFNAV